MLHRHYGNATFHRATHRKSALSELEIDASRFRPALQAHLQIALIIEIFERPCPLAIVAATLQNFRTDELTEHDLLSAHHALNTSRNRSRRIAVDRDPQRGVNQQHRLPACLCNRSRL